MKELSICAILAIFICSGYAQIDATDVIHQVDGTESVGRLTAFDGVVFTVDIQGDPIQISRAEVVSIALGQPQLRPKLLYVGSDKDDLANDAVANALKMAGFDLTSATALPASLDGFDVVVLESFSASSADAAKMLRSFVGKGGGVVLVGTVPKALSPGKGESKYYECYDCGYIYPWGTSVIADWLGGSAMESVTRSDPRISASISNPFFASPEIIVGQDLYVFRGERAISYFVTGSLSAHAQPVAKIRFEDLKGNERTHIAAFANPFGEGRVYYQYMSYEPNHPKLVELFVAGTKWAAGILPEVR